MASNKKKPTGKRQVKVNVKAGPKHKAYTTTRLEDSFASALKSAHVDQKKEKAARYDGWADTMQGATKVGKVVDPKTGRVILEPGDYGIQGPPPNPKAAKEGALIGGAGKPPDRGGAIPGTGGFSEGGAYALSSDMSPDAVKETIAAYAAELGQQLQGKDMPQNVAEETASRMAISEAQLAYHTRLKLGQFPSSMSDMNKTRGIDMTKVSVGSVKRTAFGTAPERRSTDQIRKDQKDRGAKRSKSAVEQVQEKLKGRDQKIYDEFGRTKANQAETGMVKSHGKKKAKSQAADAKLGPKGTMKDLTFDQQDIIASKRSSKKLQPGDQVSKAKTSSQKFLQSLKPDEEKWVDKQMTDPEGLFYGAKGNKVPGAYRRWQRYVNAREAGYSDRDNISEWLKSDMRGRSRETNPQRKDKSETDQMVKARYTQGTVKPEGTKPRDRYKSLAPSHEDFGVGIRVPGIPSTNDLKEQFPDKSDREIFDMRESAKQSVAEFLDNQRMAHETRQNTILGRDKSESGAGPADRVVFFTTSTGFPALSVGANSLIGQYIIKKRKKMLYDQRMVPRAALKGEYPYAVRDQHIVEVASGLSVGAQGRYGAFRQLGYRLGANKSKGYGKMLPVGSQILRDSQGQPLYDRNGNLRYTEGFTRPFDLRPSNEVGLRIYLG